MAARGIGEEKRAEVIRLWKEGISERKITRLTGLHWLTVRKVLRAEGLKNGPRAKSEYVAKGANPESPPTMPPPASPSPTPDIALIVAEVMRQLGNLQPVRQAKPFQAIAVAPAPTGYTTEQKGNVSIVRVGYEGTFEQRFLLTADRHWDNPHSDQEMQKRHLDEALRVGAGVLDWGDFYCVMAGKWDKRASKSLLRPEHQVDDYLDALIRTATEFFLPYARSFVRIGPGNHEAAILKAHETDLIARLVASLNEHGGASIHHTGYSAWCVFEFADRDGRIERKKLWGIHGYGGGGPVTRGVIGTNRRAVYVPDADIIVTGHTHDEWEVPIARTRLDEAFNQYHDEQMHIQIPTYKDEYGKGIGGFHVERGGPPKPTGATWLTFRKETKDSPIEVIRSRAK